jgi:HEAT repeat protein
VLPSLVKCLSDSEENVRSNSAWVLKQIGDKTIITLLSEIRERVEENIKLDIDEIIKEIHEREGKSRHTSSD